MYAIRSYYELAGLLRRALPEVQLVAGGGLVTSWQAPLRQLKLRLPPFDRLIFGPGEALLTALGKGEAPADYTLAAMMDYKNDSDYSHILTIEDPIEFVV